MNEKEMITSAANGLQYMSETDHPFTLWELQGEGPVEQRLLTLLDRPESTPVEKQDLPYFFRNMVKTYEGASADDLQRAERFKNLQAVLEQTLTGIEVYRLGEINIDAVITGKTKEGKVLALGTKLVET
jgi:hypothetical protein